MSTRTELLKLLSENTGIYLSGQKIGESLGVSRNAVWKAMQQLREEGYQIESRSRVGYRLKAKSNMLSYDAIAGNLRYPCELKIFDSVDSTNNVAKDLRPSDKPVLIIANKQTAGRGRLGRTFASPSGTGLYMSVSLKPDFGLDKSLYVTMAAAVAVCRAVETVAGIRPKIKWVNDVFHNGKKVCGILTEAQSNFETGKNRHIGHRHRRKLLSRQFSRGAQGNRRQSLFPQKFLFPRTPIRRNLQRNDDNPV